MFKSERRNGSGISSGWKREHMLMRSWFFIGEEDTTKEADERATTYSRLYRSRMAF